MSSLMEAQMHTPILKRVGLVLLAVGLIDIAVMIYCIVNRISYSSTFNLFAVIAGIFLLRGSLRAASIVRWLAMFMLAGSVSLLSAWPLIQPLGLTYTRLRLNPWAAAAMVVVTAGVIRLLFWVVRELGREPIQIARASAGRKPQDLRFPVAGGVAFVAVLGIVVAGFLRGETAERAKSLAEQQVGPGYRFHVSSLSIIKSSRGKSVFGVVTAWNETEIQNIRVRWEE